jgi:hypothetical protein
VHGSAGNPESRCPLQAECPSISAYNPFAPSRPSKIHVDFHGHCLIVRSCDLNTRVATICCLDPHEPVANMPRKSRHLCRFPLDVLRRGVCASPFFSGQPAIWVGRRLLRSGWLWTPRVEITWWIRHVSDSGRQVICEDCGGRSL